MSRNTGILQKRTYSYTFKARNFLFHFWRLFFALPNRDSESGTTILKIMARYQAGSGRYWSSRLERTSGSAEILLSQVTGFKPYKK